MIYRYTLAVRGATTLMETDDMEFMQWYLSIVTDYMDDDEEDLEQNHNGSNTVQ